MNVLPFVFHAFQPELDQFTSICFHREFERKCFDPPALSDEQHVPKRPPPVWTSVPTYKVLVLMVDLMLWLNWLRNQKVNHRKGTFFTILFILSLTVSFRILYSIVCTSVASVVSDDKSAVHVFCTQSSLYVDYCSNFFSISITFFMSLNRCFCFVAKHWNSMLFDGFHVVIPVVFSAFVSISGGVLAILTSQITRMYVNNLGFVDVGPQGGYKVTINRLFYLFQFGSIACYLILWRHLRIQTRLALSKSYQNRGEQKVFIQLLITVVLYGLLSVVYEAVTLVNWGANTTLQLTFISVLSIFNYLPEISLPLLLVCSSVQIRKRIAIWITPTADKTIVTAKHTNTTSTV
ncbi:unnamed protein product [Caenorhabditis sp. 36 PRJEB53466]|nr:unnamed protein product [Caenorhabditis sp. 36 PRJEB53466]